jgi:hypothetical protein
MKRSQCSTLTKAFAEMTLRLQEFVNKSPIFMGNVDEVLRPLLLRSDPVVGRRNFIERIGAAFEPSATVLAFVLTSLGLFRMVVSVPSLTKPLAMAVMSTFQPTLPEVFCPLAVRTMMRLIVAASFAVVSSGTR